MSTMFKSEAKQPNGMAAHELFLNGFHLSLSSETFSARPRASRRLARSV
jgi:hypothetical protein